MSVDYRADAWRERAIDAERRLKEARELVETIVCTAGDDKGVVLLSQDAPTRRNENLGIDVYVCEHFSPLGDALIELWRVVREHP